MRSSYDKALEAIGRSVGGFSTKIHAKVDAFGQLVNILLTPGQVHESQVAHKILAEEDCECFLEGADRGKLKKSVLRPNSNNV